jgi:multidrug efflux pump subunit AcrA (membrane-fusion protein)
VAVAAPTAKHSHHHAGSVQIQTHTIYVLSDQNNHQTLEAVSIRTGITDGLYTEVVSGLKEGEQVITSMATPSSTSSGGSFGGFPRMR